jgi:hypothetical protein
MRSRLLVLALPALIVAALVLSGCGGGGSSSTTTTAKKKEPTTPSLSKAGFISQGDAICAEVNTAIGSVEESASETSSQTTQIANLYTGMVQSLQRLGQPSEKAGYSEFMGSAEELAMVEGELKKASDEEDLVAEEEAAQEAVPAVEEFQQQAAVYGFEDCSEGPHALEVAPEASTGEEPEAVEESGGVEALPEEEIVPEEEFIPEEEVAPEEEFIPETGGAGGEIEEVPEEEVAPETEGESGGIGPG